MRRTRALAVLFPLLLAAPGARAAEPARVVVGAYIHDIQSIDLKLHSYEVDLYLWFRWTDRAIDPAASLEFANPSELWGHVVSKNYEKPEELPGGGLYQVVRVHGRFSRKLPLYGYPFDRQTLLVAFEDALLSSDELVYVPDHPAVSMNPDLVLPGFRLGEPRLVAAAARYPTTFGDPRTPEGHTFSRVRIEIPISRPTIPYLIKFLLPIACVVLCAALMFLLRPTYVDARIGIGITALLTIVALQITLNEDLPEVDYLVLMDKVYVAAYIYVIAALALVIRTTSLVDEDRIERAVTVQRRGVLALSAAFAAAVGGMIAWALVTG